MRCSSVCTAMDSSSYQAYISDDARPKPALHYSDATWVRISTAHPIEAIVDGFGRVVRYRSFKQKNKDEAVILLPGMYETCSSGLYLLDFLASHGCSCFSIELNTYDTYSSFVRGLLKFCEREEIKKVHLIGSDTGGFDAIQFASFPYLGRNLAILSITLINSFKEPKIWECIPAKFKVFGKLIAKNILLENIEKSKAIEKGSRGAVFCAKEIDVAKSSEIAKKIRRMVSSRFPIAPAVEPESILSIETTNRSLEVIEEQNPSKSMPKIKVISMEKGGDWPHIEASQETGQYIIEHIKECAIDMPVSSETANHEEIQQNLDQGDQQENEHDQEGTTEAPTEEDHVNEDRDE